MRYLPSTLYSWQALVATGPNPAGKLFGQFSTGNSVLNNDNSCAHSASNNMRQHIGTPANLFFYTNEKQRRSQLRIKNYSVTSVSLWFRPANT
jgi:hypothetical protein